MKRTAWIGCLLATRLIALPAEAFAADDPEAASEDAATGPAIDWTVFAATDHFASGISDNSHRPYVEGTMTGTFDPWRFELSGWTDGPDHDPTVELLIGYALDWQGMTFDASLARDQSPTNADLNQWILDANVTWDPTEALSLNAGVSWTAADHDFDYADLYGSATWTFENSATVALGLDWEDDYDGEGTDYLETTLTASYPVSDRVTLSAGVGYDWFDADAGVLASYAFWEAGATFTLTDGLDLDIRYVDNGLDASGCATQTDGDCDARVMATLTWSGSAQAR